MSAEINAPCHPNRFVHSRGLCRSCYDKWLRSVNPGYAKRQHDNTSEWYKRNPEKKRLHYLTYQAHLKANPQIRRNASLKSKYGITIEQFEARLTEQGRKCALCFRAEGKFRFHVDHDHKSNRVRGILCHQCNWYLGVIDRDPAILDRIKQYLGPVELKEAA